MTPSDNGRSQPPDDVETRSVISMRELDPSPVRDEFPDVEGGEYLPKAQTPPSTQSHNTPRSASYGLGLRGRNWDSWCMYIELPPDVSR